MFELIRANQRRAAILVVVVAGLLFAVGYSLGEMFRPGEGGLGGLIIAFVVWAVLTIVAYFAGGSVFLALGGARRIQKEHHPVLFNVVEEMCLASGLTRMPDLYIIDDAAPNAFATGRGPDSAAVAVTAGLLETLDRDELQGVIAHELAHVRNRDVLYMTMVGVMVGTIVILAELGRRALFWGGMSGGRRRTSRKDGGQAQLIILVVAIALMILAPILARLLYLAVSRRREYLADACSALYTRYPEGLASALEKLGRAPARMQKPSEVMAPMYIVNPLAANAVSVGLFSTHPPLEQRVKVLRSMAGGAALGDYAQAFRKVTGRAVGLLPFREAPDAQAAVPTRAPQAVTQPAGVAHLQRVRDATDALWRLNQYVFVACECGTRLKIPPVYAGRRVGCPHCTREHLVSAAG
jgi:heat shock protein HtpX